MPILSSIIEKDIAIDLGTDTTSSNSTTTSD